MKAFLIHMERESEKETTRRRMARVKGMLSSLDKACSSCYILKRNNLTGTSPRLSCDSKAALHMAVPLHLKQHHHHQQQQQQENSGINLMVLPLTYQVLSPDSAPQTSPGQA